MTDKQSNSETLRAQATVLLSQARAQAADIHRALSMGRGSPEMLARLGAMAAHIDGVVAQLSGALGASSFPLHMSDLMAIAGVVQSGEAGSLASEAAAQSSGGGVGAEGGATGTPAQRAEVAASSTETRHEVENLSHDIFEKHIFDKYLHFSSPGDEAAFRKREAESKRYIQDQLAKGTPEGNLNASGGTISYMLDAHAHGAGDSPQFMPRWNALVAKTERQYAAMRAAGQSTQEFDQHVRDGVRRFLKDEKHLSDTEIERRLSAAASPLDAAKALLKDDRAGRRLEDKVDLNAKPDKTHQPLPRGTHPVKTAGLSRSAGVQAFKRPSRASASSSSRA